MATKTSAKSKKTSKKASRKKQSRQLDLRALIARHQRAMMIFALKVAVVLLIGYMAQFGLWVRPDGWSVALLAPFAMIVATLIAYVRLDGSFNERVKQMAYRLIVVAVFLTSFFIIWLAMFAGLIQPIGIWGALMGVRGLGFDYDESGLLMMLRMLVVMLIAGLGSYWFASTIHWVIRVPVQPPRTRSNKQLKSTSKQDLLLYGVAALIVPIIWLIQSGHSVSINLGI